MAKSILQLCIGTPLYFCINHIIIFTIMLLSGLNCVCCACVHTCDANVIDGDLALPVIDGTV